MRCLDCRAAIEEGSNFCRHCGASQYVEPPLPPVSQVAPRSSLSPRSPVPRRKFDWVLAAWAAFLIVFVVAAVTAKFSLTAQKRAERARFDPAVSAESARASAEASRAIAEARAVTDAMDAELSQARADAEAAIDRAEGMAAERGTRAAR